MVAETMPDQTPRAGGTGRLADFVNLTLIGKGSYGRVYRGTRKSDGAEYVPHASCLRRQS